MYQLAVKGEFSAAHRLRGYRGRCENLHGHNYRVEAVVAGERLDRTGLLLDFGVLKKKLNAVLGRLDHAYLNELPEFRHLNPSAENLARLVYNKLQPALLRLPVKLSQVTVWESDGSAATYHEP